MRNKTLGPPVTRRSFTNTWGELDYLCQKIHYWLYTRKRKSKAEYYLERLERTLGDLPENHSAILREDGLALLCALKGDVGESVKHRRREIRLMERLHEEARSPRYDDRTRAYMLRGRDSAVLQERRAILESLKKQRSQQNGDAIRRAK